jgi:hypothetical protein
VDFCAREGVTQFLDIGSGLPTNQNVHEIAQRINADSRVVYVDNDPVVVAHARALLSGTQTSEFFGDWTLVEPGLTDIWAWRAEDDTIANTSGFMRILGGVARKERP